MAGNAVARIAGALVGAVALGAGVYSVAGIGNAEGATRSLPAALPAAADPNETVITVAHALADGDLHVAWDALPASYQRDVTGLIHDFARKMDPELWDRGFALVHKLGVVLRDKKDLILAMRQFEQSSDFDTAAASREWDHVVSLFTTIGKSDLASVETMRRMDVRRFLGTTGATIFDDLKALGEAAPNAPTSELDRLRSIRATTLSRSGDTAMVRIEIPGERMEEMSFARVEGKWIPADLASEWADQIAEARAALDGMSTEEMERLKPQLMQLADGVDLTLDQMLRAKTSAEFEQAAQMGMMQVFGGIMAIAAAQE